MSLAMVRGRQGGCGVCGQSLGNGGKYSAHLATEVSEVDVLFGSVRLPRNLIRGCLGDRSRRVAFMLKLLWKLDWGGRSRLTGGEGFSPKALREWMPRLIRWAEHGG
jgi:hypothetical protein